MEYKLSEQELQDLMHRSWLKAKKFYSGKTDEYFYEYFESEKKQLTIHSVVKSFCECTDEPMRLAMSLTKCAACQKIVED
jgi:hypothetical protein